MLREITLGQYYNIKSKIHLLDPRVKLMGTLLYIISLFIVKGIAGYLLVGFFFLVVVNISKVPIKYITRGLKAIFFILILSALCNVFFYGGEEIIFKWKFVKISLEGVEQAICMSLRLILLILGTSVLTLTTTSKDLTDGLEKSLGFLKKINVPVSEIALMMSIALRFIPILIEETNKIMKAQISRGADFEKGNIFRRVKSYIPIIIPLFVSAFKRADDLSMAMEARCYQPGANRTKLNPLKYNRNDLRAYLVLAIYLISIVIAKVVCVKLNVKAFWVL